MKGRKLLALVLALILALGLAVPALGAGTVQDHTDFDDLKDPNWSWAWPTIDDAIRRGLFVGYDPVKDAKGNTIVNFGPGDDVTMSVGLTLCARMMVDKSTRDTILADRLEQMRLLIPGTAANIDDPAAPFVWFRREAAACLELGILTAEDIEDLRDDDLLGAAMTKADFAKYLVRAMGLEDFAKGLNANELPFTDDLAIGREYRPYVKLLYSYGVLTGDENGNFNPEDSMNRAICATMLSRAIENIREEREVTVDLPRYTTYDYQVGYIRNVTLQDDGSRLMVLESQITGVHSITLPSTVSIYQYNMRANTTELKVGTFARVCYNGGEAAMVRLIPAGFLTSLEGSCDAVSDTTVVVDGVSYNINRFTEVSAGGKTGDRTIIDPESNYTEAKLVTNSRKDVLSLELSGGTRLVEGILTDVTTTNLGATTQTTATVTAFSGLPTTYVVDSAVKVSLAGREMEELKAAYKGRRAVLRVSDADVSKLVAIDLDETKSYVQGILSQVNTKLTPNRVEIRTTGETKPTPYEVDESCVITYEGAERKLSALTLGTFVTAKVEGGTLTMLSAWTGLETVEGTLTGVTYADPTILTVTKADETVSEFAIPMTSLGSVTILVGDDDGDITKLSTGDKVVVTLRYHDVVQIDVTPRSADVSGVLSAVTFNIDGSAVLSVRFTDGTVKEYTAASSATVIRNDKPVSLTELVNARGLTVSLVTSGDRAMTIQFSGTATSQDSVEGVIYNKVDTERMISVLVTDPVTGNTRPVNVHVSSSAKIATTGGEELRNVSLLAVSDSVQVYGSYKADGTFEATLVIRK